MPHAVRRIFGLSIVLAAVCAFVRATPSLAGTQAVTLAWHVPLGGHSLSANENISRLVHYKMNAILMKLAAGRADPTTILEERSQFIEQESRTKCLLVTEVDTRRYGGDHPKDSSIKKRTQRAVVALDNSGRFSPLPPFAAVESDEQSSPSPAAVAIAPQCGVHNDAPKSAPSEKYKDAGDAALAEFPAQPVAPGETWSFSRPVRVERELAFGNMTYTNRLDRLEERAGHRIAIVVVNGIGRVDLIDDLQKKGFKTASMTFNGTAEFDATDGLPLEQRYSGHVEWATRIMGARIGLIIDETYFGKPWSVVSRP